MKIFQTTSKWVDYWKRRKIDWKTHYMNPNHPHRLLLVETLKRLPWMSLIEVGCAAGANLVAILKAMPNKQVGGIDVSADAIAFAEKQFQNGMFKVNSADDIMLSDKSADIILTDMTLIYISPRKIKKHLEEFKRVARSYVVFCEFHSPKWTERLALKWRGGYNMYDYQKLLEKNGFYDINLYKIPQEYWPEVDTNQKYRYIIVARVPKL